MIYQPEGSLSSQTMWLALALICLLSGEGHSVTVNRFTNLICENLSPGYFAYKHCRLNLLGRGIVAVNVHAILLKGPFDNCKVNFSLWRRYNGFRPFMFNTTIDFCRFMAKANQKLSFEKIVIDSLSENSNLNHSCPYDHDIIVRDLVFKEEFIKYFPVPSGEYKLQITTATDRNLRGLISVHMLRQEDLMLS